MEQVNIHAAKTNLSKLLERVSKGESIVIAKAGEPVAVLGPYVERKPCRKPGGWEGRIHIADDFDETSEEIIKLFYGEAE